MTIPDRVVFDTEPIVAHADDEPGSEVVDTYLTAVSSGDALGFVNHVTLTEIRYVIARKYGREVADTYLDWLLAVGVASVSAEDVWKQATEFVLDCNPALGDAYALATAVERNGSLLVGADDDYEAVTDVAIERFRDEPA
jgi:predicted nucleic acid-binding protein